VIDDRAVAVDVLADAEAALKEAYAFSKRAFGQAVTAAEVMTILQGVEGVIAVDLDALHLTGTTVVLNQVLQVDAANVEDGIIHHAQLLLINILGIKLLEVQP
jgi:hypothetical protein